MRYGKAMSFPNDPYRALLAVALPYALSIPSPHECRIAVQRRQLHNLHLGGGENSGYHAGHTGGFEAGEVLTGGTIDLDESNRNRPNNG